MLPSPSLTSLPLSTFSPRTEQQHYLFIDGVHLTTAGQTIEADFTYSLLVAPSQMSLLAESAVQNGWAHAATIQGQIELPGNIAARGRHFWTSAGAFSLKVTNATGFASDSGTPFGGTVGMDYQTSNGLIVGAAFSAGSQIPGFSTGGHFEQVDEAPSLYVAYVGGPLWGNAVVSYDLFQDNIRRPVPLGIFTDQNNANTTGQSLALALRGGRDVTLGRFTTGPVAGLVLQEAHVDGFTETSDTGVTALSFDRQTRDSVVTQLGWRVLVDARRLAAVRGNELEPRVGRQNRTVGASLTSVVAPSYTMDAVPVVSDWATSSLGSYYELSSRVMLRAGASAMFVNPQMKTYGGELGLNVCF